MKIILTILLSFVLIGCSQNKDFVQQLINKGCTVNKPDGTTVTYNDMFSCESAWREMAHMERMSLLNRQCSLTAPNVSNLELSSQNVSEGEMQALERMYEEYAEGCADEAQARAWALAMDSAGGGSRSQSSGAAQLVGAAMQSDATITAALINGGFNLGTIGLSDFFAYLRGKSSDDVFKTAFREFGRSKGATTINGMSLSNNAHGEGAAGDTGSGRYVLINSDAAIADNGSAASTGGDAARLQDRAIFNARKSNKNENIPCDSCQDNNGPQGPVTNNGDDLEVNTPIKTDNDGGNSLIDL